MIEIVVLLLFLIGWVCHRGLLSLLDYLLDKLAMLYVGGMFLFGAVRLLT